MSSGLSCNSSRYVPRSFRHGRILSGGIVLCGRSRFPMHLASPSHAAQRAAVVVEDHLITVRYCLASLVARSARQRQRFAHARNDLYCSLSTLTAPQNHLSLKRSTFNGRQKRVAPADSIETLAPIADNDTETRSTDAGRYTVGAVCLVLPGEGVVISNTRADRSAAVNLQRTDPTEVPPHFACKSGLPL